MVVPNDVLISLSLLTCLWSQVGCQQTGVSGNGGTSCVIQRPTDGSWCGCGHGKMALGPCIGGECPDGYTCVCDYCCEGCFDDCYDCPLFTQYCENANYCELRQKCKRTCGLCVDADNDDDDDDDNTNPG